MRASMSSSASSSSLSALEHSASKSPDVQANETVRIIVDAANNEKCPNDVVAPSLLPQRPSTSPTAATAAVSSSMPAIDNFGAQLRSCASLNFAVEPGTGVAAMPSDEIAAAISSIKQQRQKQEVQTAQQKLLMLASSILQQQQGGNAPTGQQELQQRYLQSLLQSQQQQFNISPLAVTTNATSSIFSKLNTTVSALSKQPSQMATPSPTLALNLYSQLFDAINKQQQRRE